MLSLWNDAEAAMYDGLLGQRVYSSRLLGRDHALVLHGGGNTSVKIRERNLFGEDEDILYVKGSGWDLETIEAAGFAPVRLGQARRLAQLEQLSDSHMLQELRAATREPYERMIDLVSRCEAYLHRHAAGSIPLPEANPGSRIARSEIAALRREVSDAAGHPMILRAHRGSKEMAFAQRPDLEEISQEG